MSYMLADFRADIKKHTSRVPKWVANWGWAALMGGGLAFEAASEYFFALCLFIASSISFFFSVRHWQGIGDSPVFTRRLKAFGQLFAIPLLFVACWWLAVRKDNHPWSNLSAPISALFQIRTDNLQPPWIKNPLKIDFPSTGIPVPLEPARPKTTTRAGQPEKPGKVEILPPTTTTVDVTVRQAPKEEVTAKVEHLSPEEIQESTRGLLRECRAKLSNTMQGIAFFSRGNNAATGPMIVKEWENFTEDYDANFKERMLATYRLLLAKVASLPQTDINAAQVFNSPFVGWTDVRDQLKYLFLLLNEFEREKGLPITTSI